MLQFNPQILNLFLVGLLILGATGALLWYRRHTLISQALVETVSEGIIVLDAQRRIVQVNQRACSLIQSSSASIHGQLFDDTFPQIARYLGDQQLDKEVHLKGDAHPSADYRLLYNIIRNPQGKLLGSVVSLQDITHINRMNQQLKHLEDEQEKLLIIRNLISHTAHDFRTPLSVIKLSTFGIERKGNDPIKRQDYVTSIDEQVDRIDMLMKAIQIIADLDVGPIVSTHRSVNINTMMQELFEEANERAREKKISVSFDPVSIRTHLLGDIDRLKQALRNVIDNAIKFTPEGGAIQIKSQRIEHSVRIDIIDNGMGIYEEDLPNIFNRFYKPINLDGHENGLGLAICKLIVEGHGGSICVESQVNHGSTFTIMLPCLPVSSKTTQELQPLNL